LTIPKISARAFPMIQGVIVLLLGCSRSGCTCCKSLTARKYGEIAENQRIRLLPIPAPRGVIFDRDQHVVVSPLRFTACCSRAKTRKQLIELADSSRSRRPGLDPQILRERFEQVKIQPAFESILIKEGATHDDIAWVDAHQLEFPALRVEQTPQRRYPANGRWRTCSATCRRSVPSNSKDARYKVQGYKPGDIIGQDGVEAVYDEFLRGRDGFRALLSTAWNIQRELDRVETAIRAGPSWLTIGHRSHQFGRGDQLRKSPQGRGVIIAMDPNNGEIPCARFAADF
jgi:penicillin-binding protein 2